MALPTQNWRMLQPVYVSATGSAATGGIVGVLDALYAMGTATTYADGSARTPGSGSAWTWALDNTTFGTGFTTAVYGTPPTTSALNQQIIFAGTTSTAGAVWKQLYDNRTANVLYGGIGKNTGVYNTWNNATTPFTSGDFSGFVASMGSAMSNAQAYVVYMIECQESVIVWMTSPTIINTGGAVVVGAVIDPLSAAASNAESDGRLYGITTSGGGTRLPATWLSITGGTNATLFVNDATNNNFHSVVFTPGAGTVLAATRFFSIAATSDFTQRNGDLPQIPMQIITGAQYLGQLRQMFVTRDSYPMTSWESAGVVKGYLLGAGLPGVSDAMLLSY
jgi:hypothetical protein